MNPLARTTLQMLGRGVASLPKISAAEGRAVWVDIAKAVSITLVVVWHAIGERAPINEALIFLRMPLFFFVAGFFIRSTFMPGNEARFVGRTANFMWLYLLWTVILFATTSGVANVLTGRNFLEGRPTLWLLLVEPPLTLWFIYALCLAIALTMLLRRVPVGLVLCFAIVGYLWSASDGDFRSVPFFLRFLRLYPFFLVGVLSFQALDDWSSQNMRFGPLLLGIFLPLAYVVYFSQAVSWPIVTLAVSTLGLLAVCSCAQLLATTRLSAALALVGASTLYIYLMHKIVLFYLILVAARITDGAMAQPWVDVAIRLALVFVTIPICVAVGRILERTPATSPLFSAPLGLIGRLRSAPR